MDKIKDKLCSEKENLLSQLAIYNSEDPLLDKDQNIFNTSEDDVTASEGHDRIAATRFGLKQRLKEVEDALKKIEMGKYGICENCGKKIDGERLDVLATARHCLKCNQIKK